jgi:hypothetical protein
MAALLELVTVGAIVRVKHLIVRIRPKRFPEENGSGLVDGK